MSRAGVVAPGGAGCSSSDLAHHDKALWQRALQAALPGSVGTVAYVDQAEPAPDQYTITITWLEAGQDAAQPNTYQTRIDLWTKEAP